MSKSADLSSKVWDVCHGSSVDDALVALSNIMIFIAGNAGVTHEQLIAFLTKGITEAADKMAALAVAAAGPLQ